MKDLGGHLINSFYDDDSENMTQAPHHPLLDQQEKSISDDIMEENLFDTNIQYQQQQANNFINYCKNNPHQSINKPTNGSGINYYDHHNSHHERSKRSRPNVAASLPIQVPTRRMRKDFYSMKLNMMKVEESAAAAEAAANAANAAAAAVANTDESTTTSSSSSSSSSTDDSEDFSPVRRGDRNRPAIENMPAFDEDDAFLDQEYNENHYNHYLLDGLDDEHLTAEEDPMRLFASIQALAKSLHEDAELFGSLPPKRMLESPIRSIAFA